MADAVLTEGTTRRQRATFWLIGLWVAFVAVETAVIVLGWTGPNQPMGDVYNVYEPWSLGALYGQIMGVTEPWVYPPLALAPMMVPRLLWGIDDYTFAWAVFIVVLNAIGFGTLLGAATSRARRSAAVFWVLFLLAIGPVGHFRLDAVTVPIAVIAVLVLARHPAAASALLAVGAWIKIWPAALLLAAFAAARRKWVLVWPALAVTLFVCAAVIAAGGADNLFGFLTMQSHRGMQAEAPASTPYLWATLLGLPGARIFFDAEIITFEVAGPGTDVLSELMTPLLVVAAVALSVFALVRVRAGVSERRMLPPLALALVLCFLVFNKVGSPQFHVWLIAPIVLWLLWDRVSAWPYAAATLLSALLTQLVYPVFYDRVLAAQPAALLLLTARNVVLVGLLVMVVAHIVRLPGSGHPGLHEARDAHGRG